jgi:hypothetical protein
MAGADTSKEDDILEDAKQAHEAAVEAFADNYDDALDDIRFARLGEQWPRRSRSNARKTTAPA